METSTHSYTLWNIACFCNVAQKEKERKKKSQPKHTVFSDLRDSLLSWQCSALSLFSWTFDQMTKPLSLVINTSSLMCNRNFVIWFFKRLLFFIHSKMKTSTKIIVLYSFLFQNLSFLFVFNCQYLTTHRIYWYGKILKILPSANHHEELYRW